MNSLKCVNCAAGKTSSNISHSASDKIIERKINSIDYGGR